MKSAKPAQTKPAAKPSPYAVPALERGMQIVEILAEARRPLSLTEIAAKLGLASGMVYRLLRQMQEQQWLMQDAGSQKYSLSLRLYSFALSAHPNALLVEAARLPLQDLAAATNQSCHLSILVGNEIVVVAAGDAPSPLRLTVDIGSRHPAAGTTSGRLLIALQSPAEQARFKGDLPAAELKRIAAVGHNVAHHRNVHGVHDLAVPVRLAGGHAALALAALDTSPQSDKILSYLPALRRTATAIEQALGLTTIPKTA